MVSTRRTRATTEAVRLEDVSSEVTSTSSPRRTRSSRARTARTYGGEQEKMTFRAIDDIVSAHGKLRGSKGRKRVSKTSSIDFEVIDITDDTADPLCVPLATPSRVPLAEVNTAKVQTSPERPPISTGLPSTAVSRYQSPSKSPQKSKIGTPRIDVYKSPRSSDASSPVRAGDASSQSPPTRLASLPQALPELGSDVTPEHKQLTSGSITALAAEKLDTSVAGNSAAVVPSEDPEHTDTTASLSLPKHSPNIIDISPRCTVVSDHSTQSFTHELYRSPLRASSVEAPAVAHSDNASHQTSLHSQDDVPDVEFTKTLATQELPCTEPQDAALVSAETFGSSVVCFEPEVQMTTLEADSPGMPLRSATIFPDESETISSAAKLCATPRGASQLKQVPATPTTTWIDGIEVPLPPDEWSPVKRLVRQSAFETVVELSESIKYEVFSQPHYQSTVLSTSLPALPGLTEITVDDGALEEAKADPEVTETTTEGSARRASNTTAELIDGPLEQGIPEDSTENSTLIEEIVTDSVVESVADEVAVPLSEMPLQQLMTGTQPTESPVLENSSLPSTADSVDAARHEVANHDRVSSEVMQSPASKDPSRISPVKILKVSPARSSILERSMSFSPQHDANVPVLEDDSLVEAIESDLLRTDSDKTLGHRFLALPALETELDPCEDFLQSTTDNSVSDPASLVVGVTFEDNTSSAVSDTSHENALQNLVILPSVPYSSPDARSANDPVDHLEIACTQRPSLGADASECESLRDVSPAGCSEQWLIGQNEQCASSAVSQDLICGLSPVRCTDGDTPSDVAHDAPEMSSEASYEIVVDPTVHEETSQDSVESAMDLSFVTAEAPSQVSETLEIEESQIAISAQSQATELSSSQTREEVPFTRLSSSPTTEQTLREPEQNLMHKNDVASELEEIIPVGQQDNPDALAEEVAEALPRHKKSSSRRQSRRQSYMTATKSAVRERELELQRKQDLRDEQDLQYAAELEVAESLLQEMPGSVERRRTRSRSNSTTRPIPLFLSERSNENALQAETMSPIALGNVPDVVSLLDESAIKIQSVFRGWRTRKHLVHDKPSLSTDAQSACSQDHLPIDQSSIELLPQHASAVQNRNDETAAIEEDKPNARPNDINDMFSDFLSKWQSKKSQKLKEDDNQVAVPVSPSKAGPATPKKIAVNNVSPIKSDRKQIVLTVPSSTQKARQAVKTMKEARSRLPAPKALPLPSSLPFLKGSVAETKMTGRKVDQKRSLPVPTKPFSVSQVTSPSKSITTELPTANLRKRKAGEGPEIADQRKRSRATTREGDAVANPRTPSARDESPTGTRSSGARVSRPLTPVTPKRLLYLTPAEVTKTTRNFTVQNRLYRCDFDRVVVRKEIPRPPSPTAKLQAKMASSARLKRKKLMKEKGYTFGAGDADDYVPKYVTPERKAVKWSNELEVDLKALPRNSPSKVRPLEEVAPCIAPVPLDDYGNVEDASPLTPELGRAAKVVITKYLYRGEQDD